MIESPSRGADAPDVLTEMAAFPEMNPGPVIRTDLTSVNSRPGRTTFFIRLPIRRARESATQST
jgi:hypothetical protein